MCESSWNGEGQADKEKRQRNRFDLVVGPAHEFELVDGDANGFQHRLRQVKLWCRLDTDLGNSSSQDRRVPLHHARTEKRTDRQCENKRKKRERGKGERARERNLDSGLIVLCAQGQQLPGSFL